MFRPTRRISSNVLFAKTAIFFRMLSCAWNGNSKIDFSTFFLDSAVYERRKECSLRRLLRDRSGTTPIEVNTVFPYIDQCTHAVH